MKYLKLYYLLNDYLNKNIRFNATACMQMTMRNIVLANTL